MYLEFQMWLVILYFYSKFEIGFKISLSVLEIKIYDI